MFDFAVLFDMDGTLIDSEPYWHNSETRVIEKAGGTWTLEQGQLLTGTTLKESMRIIREESGIDLPEDELIRQILGTQEEQLRQAVPWFDGALDLLRSLGGISGGTALVSSSYRQLVRIVAEDAPEGALDVSVAGDEVENGKPDPEPYLKAADAFGLPASRCVVVEDSPSGVRAGLAAGMNVVAIEGQFNFADWDVAARVSSVSELSADQYRELVF